MRDDTLFILILLALVAAPLALSMSRAAELFVLDVRDGDIEPRRGHIPPRLLRELHDIVKTKPPVPHAVITVEAERGAPKLVVAGPVDEHRRQRMRNVIGQFTVQQIRTGKRI